MATRVHSSMEALRHVSILEGMGFETLSDMGGGFFLAEVLRVPLKSHNFATAPPSEGAIRKWHWIRWGFIASTVLCHFFRCARFYINTLYI